VATGFLDARRGDRRPGRGHLGSVSVRSAAHGAVYLVRTTLRGAGHPAGRAGASSPDESETASVFLGSRQPCYARIVEHGHAFHSHPRSRVS
jgi:hypothetical protein